MLKSRSCSTAAGVRADSVLSMSRSKGGRMRLDFEDGDVPDEVSLLLRVLPVDVGPDGFGLCACSRAIAAAFSLSRSCSCSTALPKRRYCMNDCITLFQDRVLNAPYGFAQIYGVTHLYAPFFETQELLKSGAIAEYSYVHLLPAPPPDRSY
jgi:hypothetical protein